MGRNKGATMNNQLCTYYEEGIDKCGMSENKLGVKHCRVKNLLSDGSCKVKGKIFDKFRERPATAYEFKSNCTEF
jgi:hypothetical protein